MKNKKGFTLIELMIVITIVAILAGVAIPTYANYQKKARRSDAQQLMLDTANKLEQYILNTRIYDTDFTKLGVNKDGWTCTTGTCSNPHYSVAIVLLPGPPPSYRIVATPVGGQASDGNLELFGDGTKKHAGATGW